MRDPSGAEILLLARCLSRLPTEKRGHTAAAILRDVEAAAAHLHHTGTLHPCLGDGSLMSRCHQLFPPPEPFASDRAFLDCIILSCATLIRHSRP